MTFINRPRYMNKLRPFVNKKIIKVLSGVRRSGKSTLLLMLQEDLLKEDVNVIAYNFDVFDHRDLRETEQLYNDIQSKIIPEKMNYIFLDEIQWVDHFEEIINSLYLMDNVDLYVTGSNAYFLSGEFATILSGRYVEIKVQPLSFKEFYDGRQALGTSLNDDELFNRYLQTSFPFVYADDDPEVLLTFLDGIYNTIVVKDIGTRLNSTDIVLTERIIKAIVASVGSPVSINSLSKVVKNDWKYVDNKKVGQYLEAISEALLLYRVERYDLDGKRYINSRDKYYLVDTGLNSLITGDKKPNLGHMIENIVFLELQSRGYKVYVGQTKQYEIDFVAQKSSGEKMYIQVSLDTLAPETHEREFRPLLMIDDNYPKLVLTLDTIQGEENIDGVVKTNLIKWLLDI
ncbi:MAG: ATP-binding protein [Lactobacillaceae bacterium]|nr:ATP-binding protein [Lactobacillaceae bacterium]